MKNNSNSSQPITTAHDYAEELRLTRLILQQYLGQIVVIFGICANSINIVVLSQKRMRVTSTNCYLLAFAAYDVLYLFLAGFLSWQVTEFPNVRSEHWYIEVCKIAQPLANLISNGGAWLVCAFTVERFIAVCMPMRGRVWCTTKRAKWIIVGVCSVSAAITFPEFFTGYFEQFKTILDDIGYYWMNPCLFTFIPIATLSVFNSLLIHAVVKANRARKEMQEQRHGTETRRKVFGSTEDDSRCHALAGNSNGANKHDRASSEQQKLTIMLIVVVIAFLVCQIPAALSVLFKKYIQTHKISLTNGEENIRRIFGCCSNILVQLNHASNFIVYSMFSTKFRQTFKRVFCRCAPPCKQHSQVMTATGATTAFGNETEVIALKRNSMTNDRPHHASKDSNNCLCSTQPIGQSCIMSASANSLKNRNVDECVLKWVSNNNHNSNS